MKTTKKHYKAFRRECNYWIDRLNLREWCFYYSHANHSELTNALAWRETNWKGRVATVGLSKSWKSTNPTKKRMAKSAFHEIIEVLLADVEATARVDITPQQDAELAKEMHSIVRRLEWALWKPDYESRKRG